MTFRSSTTELGADNRDTVVEFSTTDRNKVLDAQLTELTQHLYSIVLFDTATGETVTKKYLDPANRTENAEFFFRVPPKVLEFEEPFATNVQSTQNGGKFVESYGSVIKMIKVSGTTGFRPNKSTTTSVLGNNINTSNVPILGSQLQTQASQLGTLLGNGLDGRNRLPQDEATGHDDVMFLRNIFRLYSDIKAGDVSTDTRSYSSRSVVMLWRNIKDLDYWVVEPENFRIAQSSQSPLTYEYSISFKTLSRFNFQFLLPTDPQAAIRNTQRMMSRIQNYSQNLFNIFATISTTITRIEGYGSFITSTVVGPLLNVLNGLNAVTSSAFGISKYLYVQATTLDQNITTAINQLVESVANGPPDPTDLTISSYSTMSSAARAKLRKDAALAYPEYLRLLVEGGAGNIDPNKQARAIAVDQFLRSLRRAQVVCAQIRSEPIATQSSLTDLPSRLDRLAGAYISQGTTTGGPRTPTDSPTYIGYEVSPSSVSGATVYPGEDIRDLAERLLGEAARWRILVALNELRYPYVDATRAPGVLVAGDTILFPTSVTSKNKGNISTQNQTSNETALSTSSSNQGMSPIRVSYGRDLMLKSSQVGGAELTDLVINQGGDIASIQGIPNVEQALKIKFMTEKGELPAHPLFGAKYGIGRKATPSSFNDFRINTINTIKTDTRVTGIKDIQFLAVGDALAITAHIELAENSDTLSTSFALRRF